jgi:hypothetical protein
MVGQAWADWCEVGTMEVRSGKLTAVDFGVMDPASGVTVEVAKGPYRVQARIMSFGGSLGICAARALSQSLPQVVRGPVVGKVSVDIAKITIADIADTARGLTEDDFEAISQQIRGRRKTFGSLITLKLPSKIVQLPCIASGFGDGTYPAFLLTHNGAGVGIEVEFVKDGHVWRSGSGKAAEDRAALTKLEATLRDDPTNMSARYGRAAIQFRQGKFAAAVTDLDAYLSVQPTDHRALVIRGMAAHFLKKEEDALQFLNRAMELQPDDRGILLHRSSVLKALGHAAEAKADMRRWLSQLPGSKYRAKGTGSQSNPPRPTLNSDHVHADKPCVHATSEVTLRPPLR